MSEEWKNASIASTLGKIAWILGVVGGIVELIFGIIFVTSRAPKFPTGWETIIHPYYVYYIIAGIVCILLSIIIIKPKFSDKCANQDLDALYDWVLKLGSIRLPWILIWSIILMSFGTVWLSWGGDLMFVVFSLLIISGPKKFVWKEE